MPRSQRKDRSRRSDRARFLGTALGLAAFGFALLVAPQFFTNPSLRQAFLGLRTLAWAMIAVGLLLIAAYKLVTRAGTSPKATNGPRTTNTAYRNFEGSPTEEARGGPLLDDVVPDDFKSSKAPTAPSEWSGEVFDVIEWRRFEALCEWLFSQAGFETKSQSHGADGGIDIWLSAKSAPNVPVSVVQCKHWSSRAVKIAEVRALLGSMADKKVKRGIFATTSTFTHDARQFAESNGIQLLDRKGLLELISSRNADQQRELLVVATKGEFWKPTCPSCGVKMIRRARKKDGARFWGCVNFPRCLTAINGR